MNRPIDNSALAAVLERMGISDISDATIRQSGEIARSLERELGVEFLHLEMGIPGLPPAPASATPSATDSLVSKKASFCSRIVRKSSSGNKSI